MLRGYVLERVRTAQMRRVTLLLFVGIFVLSGLAMAGLQMIRPAAAEGGYNWNETIDGYGAPHFWTTLDMSDDEQYLIGGTYDDYLYVSSDGGETWQKKELDKKRAWKQVSVSNNGQKMTAISGGDIHVSVDYGETWSRYNPTGSEDNTLTAGVISGDGATQVVTSGLNGNGTGMVYVSRDSGVNWQVLVNEEGRDWQGVDMSSDGTHIVAAVNAGYLYTSTDSGLTWDELENAGLRDWVNVKSTPDGTHIVAAVNAGYLYTSTDSGLTWDERADVGPSSWRKLAISEDSSTILVSNGSSEGYISKDGGDTWSQISANVGDIQVNLTGIAVSLDGSTIVAGDLPHLFISNDNAATWSVIPVQGTRSWAAVAVASDDAYIIAAPTNGYLYTSSDGGVTWTERQDAGSREWASVAMSNDGSELIAAPTYGYLYTSSDGGATWTELSSMGENGWLSVDLSDDGVHYIAAATSIFFTSSDSGGTWVPSYTWGFSGKLQAVAMSSDGSRQVVVTEFNENVMYISQDSGATWTTQGNPIEPYYFGHRRSLAMSSNGMVMTISTYDGSLIQTLDGGATWERRSAIYGSWSTSSLATSENGEKIIISQNNRLSISIDSGQNWTEQTLLTPGDIRAVGMSSDGERVIALGYSSGIWTANFNPTKPASPESLGVLDNDARTDTSLTLVWTPPVDNGGVEITDYKVEYSLDGVTWVTHVQPPSINQEATITGLIASTNYFFRVSAVNEIGVSEPSEVIQVRTLDPTLPLSPSQVSVEAGERSATLRWNAYGGDQPIDNYEVQYRKVGADAWSSAASNPNAAATTYIVDGLLGGQPYEFRIRSLYWYDSQKIVSPWVTESLEESTPLQLPSYPVSVLFYGSSSFATSSDGQKMVGYFDGNAFATSQDAGTTWVNDESIDPDLIHVAVATSGDGSILVRSSSYEPYDFSSQLYIKTNNGTWEELSDVSSDYLWMALAVSSDGSALYASGVNGSLELSTKKSTDGGSTWSDFTSPDGRAIVSMSVTNSGTLYAAALDMMDGPASTSTYVSTNGGESWSVLPVDLSEGEYVTAIDVTSDGGRIIASVQGEDTLRAVISKDNGTTWMNDTYPASIGFWAGHDNAIIYVNEDMVGWYKKSPLLATPSGTNTSEEPSGNETGGAPSGDTPSDKPGASPSVRASAGAATPPIDEKSFEVDGDSIDDTQSISSTPTFSGYAKPYDHIVVTVHSDPVTCETDADASGYWECTLSEKLPAGAHTVLVKVISASNGSVTEHGPYTVTVAESATGAPVVTSETPEDTTTKQDSGQDTFWWWVAGGIVALIVVAIIVAAVRRSRQSAA